MKKAYLSPIWRSIINTILSILVGISLSVLGDWNSSQDYFISKIIFFIIILILNLSFIIFCSHKDHEEHNITHEIKKENDVYKKALSGIILTSQENATQINNCMHEYLLTGKINPGIWSYKTACYNLCAVIYEFIIKLTDNERIEVSYVKLSENNQGEIQLYAYRNQPNQPPTLLNKKRNYLLKDSIQYFDMKMFQLDNAETKVLYGYDEINNEFYRTSSERNSHPRKYREFIAVPVFCDNQKMIGLLQVACLDDCSLAEDKALLEEVAKKFLVPYANLFLLLHKMNKAFHIGIDKGGE